MPDTPSRKLTYAKACELVGHFMNAFALMESALNDSIAKLLGLDSLEAIIATSNMPMRSKVHVFKTMINLRGGTDWAKGAVKTAQAISDKCDIRNTVAHVPFGVNDRKDAVEFLPVKAKGKLTFPEMIWSKPKFDELTEEMGELKEEIRKITARLLTTKALLKAHRELTSEETPSPETQRLLMSLLRGDPGSDTASSGIAPRKPQEPQG